MDSISGAITLTRNLDAVNLITVTVTAQVRFSLFNITT